MWFFAFGLFMRWITFDLVLYVEAALHPRDEAHFDHNDKLLMCC
jgi:hypothetical protein